MRRRASHDSLRSHRHLSFLTLQRRNALGDALRHNSAPRRLFTIGRRTFRTAYPLVLQIYVGIYNSYSQINMTYFCRF
ncbi:hypothetical protein CC205_06770 [Pseudomonas savastanoi pv. nerii]|uniref:DUF1534 domain-containing protein n=1 Tax=Pseudomonas savastanoi pv. nerii TaxID=360921 RepID=A0AB73RPG6_PSESS|nr:hypothetical protein CC202_20745 [Pseudomonas savastanoi]PAB37346.1 hypothetical protein CC205_06770 [Pseudomonas savastanoi pv. nerii]